MLAISLLKLENLEAVIALKLHSNFHGHSL